MEKLRPRGKKGRLKLIKWLAGLRVNPRNRHEFNSELIMHLTACSDLYVHLLIESQQSSKLGVIMLIL